MRRLSESMLLPALDEPSSRLYAAGEGDGVRLRPQYRWYVEGLARTAEIARCVTVAGDSLLLRLGAALDTTRAPLSPAGC